jgi:hypothetical protein
VDAAAEHRLTLCASSPERTGRAVVQLPGGPVRGRGMSLDYRPKLLRTLADKTPRLAVGYVICVTVAVGARDVATSEGLPAVSWAGDVVLVVAFSGLLTVFALYRDDDLLVTAIMLTVINGVAAVVALLIDSIIKTRSIFAAIVLIIVAPFAYLLRALTLVPVFACLVWICRKSRRFLAPDTLNHEDAGSG